MKKFWILLISIPLLISGLNAQDVEVNVGDSTALNKAKAMDLYNTGLQKLNSNQLDQAIADFNQAIELMPDFVQAYFNRGAAYFEQKKYKEAQR